MMPRPPAWIKHRMTSCPNRLKAVPVSTTTRPVTQLADTEVNSASTNARLRPVAAAGSISKPVPAAISAAKAKMEVRAGDRKRIRRIEVADNRSHFISADINVSLGDEDPITGSYRQPPQ